jgi:hypothetical protein
VNTENNSRGSPGVSLESEETSESATTNLSSTTGTEPEQSESAKKKNPKSKKQSNTKQKVEDNAEKNPKLPERKNKREPWQIHKEALKKKFKDVLETSPAAFRPASTLDVAQDHFTNVEIPRVLGSSVQVVG